MFCNALTGSCCAIDRVIILLEPRAGRCTVWAAAPDEVQNAGAVEADVVCGLDVLVRIVIGRVVIVQHDFYNKNARASSSRHVVIVQHDF